MRGTVEERFWSKVTVGAPSECWDWTAHKIRDGYGHIKIKRKMILAHRLSWQLANGDIPAKMLVLHRCDNPGCVNPSHLFLGTDLDNARDRDAKGRRPPPVGENNGRAKLSSQNVRDILLSEKPRKELAAAYSVSGALIDKIKNRQIWKSVL